MNVTKLSHNSKDGFHTRVEWTDAAGNERTLSSRQRPHSDLTEALADLRFTVAEACLLFDVTEAVDDEPDVLAHLTVRGFTLKDLDDAVGVTITALRGVDWTEAPLVLNTPFAPVDLLPTPAADRLIKRAALEAQLFVTGKRAPGSPDLFTDLDGDDA